VPTVSIGDADIYFEDHGAGPPLLLVPGLNGLGSFWAKQVPALAPHFRVITHDHRGAGRSTHSRIRYSVEQMAGDVVRLMDGLGIESAHFAGHSTGGAIGQVIAQDHPGRLRSLVLSATWAGPDPYFRRLFEMRKEALLGLGLESYSRASALLLFPPWWISANDETLSVQERQGVLYQSPVEVMVSRIDAIVRFDRRAQLGKIDVPTLVICAADDIVTPRLYSDELARAIAGARQVVLDRGGHFVPVIQAEAYNQAVGHFLLNVKRIDPQPTPARRP
jgi:aminoacrylate hydrolase